MFLPQQKADTLLQCTLKQNRHIMVWNWIYIDYNIKKEDTRPWQIIFRRNSKLTIRWTYVTKDIFLVRANSLKIGFIRSTLVILKTLVAFDQVGNISQYVPNFIIMTNFLGEMRTLIVRSFIFNSLWCSEK